MENMENKNIIFLPKMLFMFFYYRKQKNSSQKHFPNMPLDAARGMMQKMQQQEGNTSSNKALGMLR